MRRKGSILILMAASAALLVAASPANAWWGDAYVAGWGNFPVTLTDCGTYGYCWSHFASCSARGFNATLNPGFQWNGRGYIVLDYVNCGAGAETGDRVRYRNQAGALTGSYKEWNSCAYTCSWRGFEGGETGDLYNWNGVYLNADESWTTGCGNVCGTARTAIREIHQYGDKWVYLNDWIVFGGYGSGSISDTANRSFPWGEAGLYAYGAVDTTHGDVISNSLYSGKKPYRVQTGDCGNAGLGNYLNFKGNAGQNSNNNCDNCDAYAFAWVYAPGGAGPMWGIGSDDGVRVWQNGTLIHDNNASRGVTWDQDRITAPGMSAGWNRVLFKVHNGGGGFGGVISLHAGNDFRAMEGSVSLQGDRYGGYSVGYEQDAWFPGLDVAAFEGLSNPQPNNDVYTNDTTVNANGTAWGNGPVPFWKVMHWEWGYGISETNYADVSSSGTTWSHTQTGVTGHRRFHFFAVSKSGRTSRQNSGASGGDTWDDSGHGNYIDVYVDNVAPANPSINVSPANPTQISLSWSLPLDQGVNIAAGSSEAADETVGGGGATQYYRRGDVGVQVYRGGSIVSSWGTGTSYNDTSLSANTQYTYTIEARDNTSQSRGAWANYTGPQGSTSKYTLQNNCTTPSFSNIDQESLTVATTGPVNLSSGSSGVIFNRGGTDLAKVQSLSISQSGLTPNTMYVYTAKGVNGDNVATDASGSNAEYTLARPPIEGETVACDKATNTWLKGGADITFTNPNGFGTNSHGQMSGLKVSKFRYKWNNSPTHSFTGSESEWTGGSLAQAPTATGEYYLHLQSLNGSGAATAQTLTLGPYKVDGDPPTEAGKVTVTGSSTQLTVDWSASVDNESGFKQFKVYGGATEDFTPDDGTNLIYTGANLTYTDIIGSPNQIKFYKIRSLDNVENAATTAAQSGRTAVNATNSWTYSTGASVLAAPGIIPYSEVQQGVFAGSNDKGMHGVTLDAGNRLYAPLGTGGAIKDRVAVIKEYPVYGLNEPTVFASSEADGVVYSQNAATGAQKWAEDVTSGNLLVKPAGKLQVTMDESLLNGRTNPRNVVLVGTYDLSTQTGNSFVCLDMADGYVYYTTAPGNLDIVTGSAAIYGTTAYFTSYAGSGSQASLWALDIPSGTVAWSKTGLGNITGAPALSADGSVVYCGNTAGTLFAVSTGGSHDVLWSKTPGGGAIYGAPFITSSSAMYVATASQVHKIDPASGNNIWSKSVALPSQPIVGSSGNLYVGGTGGNLYQMSTSDGSYTTFSLGASGALGDPVVSVIDGSVYVGAADGRIYKVIAPF